MHWPFMGKTTIPLTTIIPACPPSMIVDWLLYLNIYRLIISKLTKKISINQAYRLSILLSHFQFSSIRCKKCRWMSKFLTRNECEIRASHHPTNHKHIFHHANRCETKLNHNKDMKPKKSSLQAFSRKWLNIVIVSLNNIQLCSL